MATRFGWYNDKVDTPLSSFKSKSSAYFKGVVTGSLGTLFCVLVATCDDDSAREDALKKQAQNPQSISDNVSPKKSSDNNMFEGMFEKARKEKEQKHEYNPEFDLDNLINE